ncbi:MAG: hypothetical protein ACHQLQ_10515 [Candidatus Acidiferrales bacterium]
MATGHRASRQSAHVVTTILGNIGGGWRFLVVMLGDRAVVSGAAIHGVRGPCGSGEWGVEKYDRE